MSRGVHADPGRCDHLQWYMPALASATPERRATMAVQPMNERPGGGELWDEFVLLCGPCQEQHGDRVVLAVVTIFPNSPDPEDWHVGIRLPSRLSRDDTDMDTWMLLGDSHRMLAQGWSWHDEPLELEGCGRHHLQRSRRKLARAIVRARSRGEDSLLVTG